MCDATASMHVHDSVTGSDWPDLYAASAYDSDGHNERQRGATTRKSTENRFFYRTAVISASNSDSGICVARTASIGAPAVSASSNTMGQVNGSVRIS